MAARQLPCVLSEVLDRLHGALEETRPDLVVCLGQASGRSDVSVERVAINLVDARIPDNAGRQPIDEPVIAGGGRVFLDAASQGHRARAAPGAACRHRPR